MRKGFLQCEVLFLISVLLLSSPLRVFAGDSGDKTATVVSGPASSILGDKAVKTNNPMQLDLFLYFWPAGLDGDVSVDSHSAHTNLKFRKIIDDLKMGANGAFKISKNDWYLFNDFIYLDLSHKTSENIASIPGASIDATLDTRVLMDMLVFGRQWQKPVSWSLFAGARYYYGRVRLDAIGNLGPEHKEAVVVKTNEWVTPVIGAGVELPFNDKLSFNFAADVGRMDKSFSWEAVPKLCWKFNNTLSAEAGYRVLDIRHKDEGFKLDTLMHGPIVGMKITF